MAAIFKSLSNLTSFCSDLREIHDILYRSSEDRRRRKTAEEAQEFVDVPEHLMGFVIGKEGSSIKQIKAESKAKLDSEHGGFLISGSEEQRARARELVQQKVVSVTK